MQKWAFSTVGPVTKVYASSSSLVDNKNHWREERRTSKKGESESESESEREKSSRVFEVSTNGFNGINNTKHPLFL